MLTTPVNLVTAGSMTGTAVVNGPAQQMTNALYFVLQCVWTGTPTGVFKLQTTTDVTATSSTTWTDLSTKSYYLEGSQPAGSASNLLFTSAEKVFPGSFIRLVYTNGSGTGTFSAAIFAKGA